MEAAITIKATPAEFDDLREAVEVAKEAALEESGDSGVLPAVRRLARERSIRLDDLQKKLR